MLSEVEKFLFFLFFVLTAFFHFTRFFLQVSDDEQLSFIDRSEKLQTSSSIKENIPYVNGDNTWQLIDYSNKLDTVVSQFKIPLSHREIVTVQSSIINQQESRVWSWDTSVSIFFTLFFFFCFYSSEYII